MADETALQQGWALNTTEDFITRTYVLPLLADESTRNRLIDEHRNNPIESPERAGDQASVIVLIWCVFLTSFGRAPQAGKYCRVCTKPHVEWRIGILSGVRGKPIQVLPDTFASEDDCEHAISSRELMIFSRRTARTAEVHPVSVEHVPTGLIRRSGE